MLNVTEVESLLENHEFISEGVYEYGSRKGQPYRYVNSGWGSWDEKAEPVQVEHLGEVRMRETYTGAEDGGSNAELIFEVNTVDGDTRYFHKTGYYSSYNGTEWDGDFREVKPVQKTITVFE